MQRCEAQFCRDEAERLLKLARETSDPKIKQELVKMAGEWVERAKAKEAGAH